MTADPKTTSYTTDDSRPLEYLQHKDRTITILNAPARTRVIREAFIDGTQGRGWVIQNGILSLKATNGFVAYRKRDEDSAPSLLMIERVEER